MTRLSIDTPHIIRHTILAQTPLTGTTTRRSSTALARRTSPNPRITIGSWRGAIPPSWLRRQQQLNLSPYLTSQWLSIKAQIRRKREKKPRQVLFSSSQSIHSLLNRWRIWIKSLKSKCWCSSSCRTSKILVHSKRSRMSNIILDRHLATIRSSRISTTSYWASICLFNCGAANW